MTVKTFQAATMAEALAKVKAELGTQAVILHTRSFQRGGVLGFRKKTVVEITATRDVPARQTRKPATKAASGSDRGGTAVMEAPVAAGRARAISAAYAGRLPVMEKVVTGEESGVPEASTKAFATAMLKEPAFEMRNELASLRVMVESLLQRTAATGSREDLPDQLSGAYTQLITQEVSDEIAYRVVEDLKAEFPADQLKNSSALKEALVAKLEAMVPAGHLNSVARPAAGTGCRSICLVGPTGVGKTTTIAKLAAAFKLKQRLKVGLITIDTYRIAAVDQLRTYANIIGVPVKVVLTPQELLAAMREFADYDVVLIDTAGRSHSDQIKINELAQFIKTANPTEVHLVLSSTCTQHAMEAAVKQFSRARVDQIIFTKLDEAVSFGVLLNVARRASKALSYITTGQDVPDNIEVGQPRRLAKLILGEKL